jgi:hypothetical protein
MTDITLDDLDPEDREMMFWYEQDEAGLPPWDIDPQAKVKAEAERAAKKAAASGAQGIAAISDE